MTKTKRPLIWIIGIFSCICVALITGIAVVFFVPAIFNPFVPIYSFHATSSAQAGYPRYTLTHGHTIYVSDYEEYALSSPGNDHEIGQTLGGIRLIEITGQGQYIVAYSFMDQVAVFKSTQAATINLSTAGVTDMKLASLAYAPGLGPEKSTQDSELIQEVTSTLAQGTPVNASSLGSGTPQKYCLYLSGGTLIGMQYCVAVYVDSAGNVYLAHDTLSPDWIPATQTVSDWVKTP